MTMTNAQKNGVSEMQAMASLLVVARSKATLLSEIYTNEGLGSLTNEDFAEIPAFAHITATEFAAAAAINSIVTALNTGTPAAWTKMLKIVETMPR
jgi:hypothetical protein